MAREKYFLFIDEVKPTPPFKVYNFTGVAIKACDYEDFRTKLNDVKDKCIPRLGGKNINLHFSPLVGKKKEFAGIRKDEENSLWGDLFDLFEKTNFHILAGIVDDSKYKYLYPHYRVKLETLAFKELLQNFVRFLHLNNGFGELIVESSCDDIKLTEEFYRQKFSGSECITTEGYNLVIRGIKFESKEKLNEGLQLVDFIANPVSRLVSNMKQFSSKIYPETKYADILEAKIYEGAGNTCEFGITKRFI